MEMGVKRKPLRRNVKRHVAYVKTVIFLFDTRKYPLRGYILGVLTHTTAWDRLWGGNVSLRLYKCSFALPQVAAVSRGF